MLHNSARKKFGREMFRNAIALLQYLQIITF